MSHGSLMMGTWPVVVSGLVQGLGMGLIFIPLNTMAFATLGSTYRTDGASLLNLVRSVGASVGISVVTRSEEHTSELQSLMRISYAVFCLKKKKKNKTKTLTHHIE